MCLPGSTIQSSQSRFCAFVSSLGDQALTIHRIADREPRSLQIDLSEAQLKLNDIIALVEWTPGIPHQDEIVKTLDQIQSATEEASKQIQQLDSSLVSSLHRVRTIAELASRRLRNRGESWLNPRQIFCRILGVQALRWWLCDEDPNPEIEAVLEICELEFRVVIARLSMTSRVIEQLETLLRAAQSLLARDQIAIAISLDETLAETWASVRLLAPGRHFKRLRRQAETLKVATDYRERTHRYILLTIQRVHTLSEDVEAVKRMSGEMVNFTRESFSQAFSREATLTSIISGLQTLDARFQGSMIPY
ncbi:hypothetical protein SISSUDRAFT_1037283 [Sistotremastrum suecicum HHB10207 ss-3]|uniref:Uncharacterized protein n=1 Tax=Sistotremastrum suecicum HHB10207 ss-3 TaxID=1314776 RepID=A0A165YCM7_9AGAM|nr:hypothetical protein SISSUDRAFT_1037283 [Sistotremastrum suecicum HHB10207 ss-3]